jgi:hypothetical protein
MPNEPYERMERHATYTSLTGLFMALFAGLAWYQNHQRREVRVKPFELVQLGFATYRLGRLLSYDKVTEPYRAPFTQTVPDASGAGMTVVSRGTGFRGAIGDLITCPVCTGTWVAAGLVYGLNLIPRPTRMFLNIMSSVGIAELLDAATEALQWTGQLQRERAGMEHGRRLSRNNGGPRLGDEPLARFSKEPATPRFEDRSEWKEHEHRTS